MRHTGKRFYTVREFIITYRGFFVFFFHASAVVVANYIAFLILFEGAIPARLARIMPYSILLVLAVRLPLFKAFGLYKGLWKYTGISDVIRIVFSVTVGTLVYMTLDRIWLFGALDIPLSVVVMDWLLTMAFINSIRLLLRVYEDYVVSDKKGKKVLIIGAGNAGEMIVRDMRKNLHLHKPVGFVDDDRRKKGLSIHGVPILGTTEDLFAIISEYRPEEVLIAIPSAKPETMIALMKS